MRSPNSGSGTCSSRGPPASRVQVRGPGQGSSASDEGRGVQHKGLGGRGCSIRDEGCSARDQVVRGQHKPLQPESAAHACGAMTSQHFHACQLPSIIATRRQHTVLILHRCCDRRCRRSCCVMHSPPAPPLTHPTSESRGQHVPTTPITSASATAAVHRSIKLGTPAMTGHVQSPGRDASLLERSNNCWLCRFLN